MNGQTIRNHAAERSARRAKAKREHEAELAGTWAGQYVTCLKCNQAGRTTLYLRRKPTRLIAVCGCGNRAEHSRSKVAA